MPSSVGNPRVVIDVGKLRHNLEHLVGVCHAKGVSVAVVTKVVCADPQIVALIEQSEADFIADSRVENLAAIHSSKPRMLLRLSQPSEVEQVILNAEISLQSELSTIAKLGQAARLHKRPHQVVLMVDMGDLREGIFYEDRSALLAAARAVMAEEYLQLQGIGVNLTCYGAVIPDEQNLGGLVAAAEYLREQLHIDLSLVSGGNSSSYTMVRDGLVPAGINNLRLGEAFVLGNDTALCQLMPELRGDAFMLVAELIEVQTKPSKPIGRSGANAFGETVSYPDLGLRRRGILAIGRQDTNAEGLVALDKRVHVLGASSDHLLVDLTEAPEYEVGQEVAFGLDYGTLLRAFTSAYVKRQYKTVDSSGQDC